MVTRIVRSTQERSAPPASARLVTGARRAAGGLLGLAGERMAKVDTAWLRMDSAHNLMMIVGVWTLRPRIGHDELCGRVEERLLKYPRFRQRVVEDAACATWVDMGSKLDVRQQVVK